MYNGQVKEHGRTRKAVIGTIRICKNENLLKEYLESREKEVVDMMMTLFDETGLCTAESVKAQVEKRL